MKMASIRAIVRRSANTDKHEYLKHDGLEFTIAWGIDRGRCPSPNYPVMIKRSPDYNQPGKYWNRVFIYRYPDGEEWLGHADATVREYPQPPEDI